MAFINPLTDNFNPIQKDLAKLNNPKGLFKESEAIPDDVIIYNIKGRNYYLCKYSEHLDYVTFKNNADFENY